MASRTGVRFPPPPFFPLGALAQGALPPRAADRGFTPGGSDWRIPPPFFRRFELGSAKIRINDQRCHWTPAGLIGLPRAVRRGSNLRIPPQPFPLGALALGQPLSRSP